MSEKSVARPITEAFMTPSSWLLTRLGINPDQVTATGLSADIAGTVILNLARLTPVDPYLYQQAMKLGVTLRLFGLGCDLQDGALSRYRDNNSLPNNPEGAIVDFRSDRIQEMLVFAINAFFALVSQEYVRAGMGAIMIYLTLLPSRLRGELEKAGKKTQEDVVGSRVWRVGLSFLENITRDELSTLISALNVSFTLIAIKMRTAQLQAMLGEDHNSPQKTATATQKIEISKFLDNFALPASYFGLTATTVANIFFLHH